MRIFALHKIAMVAVAIAVGSAGIATDAWARGGGGGHGGGGGGHFGGGMGGGHFGGGMGGDTWAGWVVATSVAGWAADVWVPARTSVGRWALDISAAWAAGSAVIASAVPAGNSRIIVASRASDSATRSGTMTITATISAGRSIGSARADCVMSVEERRLRSKRRLG